MNGLSFWKNDSKVFFISLTMTSKSHAYSCLLWKIEFRKPFKFKSIENNFRSAET